MNSLGGLIGGVVGGVVGAAIWAGISYGTGYEIGWLAWSWGPGNEDCGEMDMTEDGRFETLHGWGLKVAMTDPHSIQRTSRIPESVYRRQCARAVGSTQQ